MSIALDSLQQCLFYCIHIRAEYERDSLGKNFKNQHRVSKESEKTYFFHDKHIKYADKKKKLLIEIKGFWFFSLKCQTNVTIILNAVNFNANAYLIVVRTFGK